MLLSLLGDPQNRLKFIHIAGTNGKGSVAMLLSNVLTVAGYQTGLFVSPGISAVNDRFRINGNRISDDELMELARKVQAEADTLPGGFCEFELMMCVGFLYYEKHLCDIVVLETGIGGRLDCTNQIPEKEVAVITSIGLDHTKLLGDTLEAIAFEKAGIIAQNGIVVCGVMPSAAQREIKHQATEKNAKVIFVQEEEIGFLGFSETEQLFSYQGGEPLQLSLIGRQQLRNAAVVLEVCNILERKGWLLPKEAIAYGLSHTVWEGRMELLSKDPTVLLDGAHNPESAEMLRENLQAYFSDKQVIYVIGMMKDKNKEGLLHTLLPGCKAVITVTIPGSRGERGEILADLAKEYCQNYWYNVTIKEALKSAESLCGENDMICVCGSLYLIQEVREYYKAGECLD